MSIRSIILSLVVSSSLMNADVEILKIDQVAVVSPGIHGAELFFSEGKFAIVKDGEVHSVKPHDVDRLLKGLNNKQLCKYAAIGKFRVNRFENGEYSVSSYGALNGGGAVGATVGAAAGKMAVHGAAQAVYAIIGGIVSIFCPPAGAAVYTALQLTFAVPVEMASNVGAVAGGIALGVATGPV